MSPLKTVQLNGKMSQRGAGAYLINMVASQDNDKRVRAVVDLNAKARTFDVKAYYSPGMSTKFA